MKDILNQEINIGDMVTYAWCTIGEGVQLKVGPVQEFYNKNREVVIKAGTNQFEHVFPKNVLVIVPAKAEPLSTTTFKAKRVVLTGRIPGWSRDNAIAKLNKWGATVSETVSTADFILVMDDAIAKNTTKYQTAERSKKRIVGQTEFIKLLGT